MKKTIKSESVNLNSFPRRVKDKVYDLNVKIFPPKKEGGKPKKFGTVKRNKKIFYYCVIALPLLQCLIFYVGVNFNTIILAFQKYDMATGSYGFAGLDNFTRFFSELFQKEYFVAAIRNSFLLYACGVLIGTTLAVLFSYFLYKKMPMSGFFRVVLFMPQIISSLALVLMFRYFFERGIPQLLLNLFGWEVKVGFNLPVMIFYSIFVSFGTPVLMYWSAMSGISESIVESAQLDGITPFKELWYITIPSIFPTLVTFITIGVAGIFTSQMFLYDFFGLNADYQLFTFGYYLYRAVKLPATTLEDYPYIASIGLVLTLITLPLTLVVKKLLERFGPSAER